MAVRKAKIAKTKPGTTVDSRPPYQTYVDRSPEIRHKACDELPAASPGTKHQAAVNVLTELSLAVEYSDQIRGFSPRLSWSHYRTLPQVEHRSERLFYEIEAEKEGWSVPCLERQFHSLLFARLLKSRDKAGVLAIIRQLQECLLELGKGFAFVARQKRLAYEDDHFYVDLVFYNTILKSYVRLFDDQFTTEADNPTIGLILCAEKNEAIARYSVLSESRNIFAAKYVKYLPTVEAEGA